MAHPTQSGGVSTRKVKVRRKPAPASRSDAAQRKGARTPKVKPAKSHSPAFGPVSAQATPFAPAQARAKRKVHQAQRKLPERPLPAVPPLKHPTAAQRKTAGDLYVRSRKKALGGRPSQVGAERTAAYERELRQDPRSARRLAQIVHLVELTPAEQKRIQVANRMRVTARGTDSYHKHAKLPFATVDLTAAERAIGSHLKGNPLSATYRGLEGIASAGPGIIGHATRDAVDLPSNTITSSYALGKEVLTGHPVEAGKMLAAPIVQTIKHPLKSFKEHPLDTVLIGRGIKGAIGHGAGGVMRTGALGKAAKRAASTERAAKVLPHSKRVIRRQYSKDSLTKIGQVAYERHRAKVRVKRGGPAEAVASRRDINRAVDEDVQAAKIVTQHNQSRTAEGARDAVAPKKGKLRGRHKPDAATSLAAQGITDATRGDLEKYLGEIRKAQPKLSGARLERNLETQALVAKALDTFDPVAVDRAAKAYQAHARELDAAVTSRNLVDPAKAEQTRLTAAKARREKTPSSATLGAKKAAAGAYKRARRAARLADAEFEQAHTAAQAARETHGGVPPVEHDALLKAIDRRDQAHATMDAAKAAALAADAAHIRASRLAVDEEPAYVSHQALEARSPALPTKPVSSPVKIRRKGQAVKEGSLDAHPAKLVEQAVSTQRLVDSADARARFVDDYGYRKSHDGPVEPFGNQVAAARYAEKHLPAGDWEPIKRDDGKFSLMPKAAMDRARAHEGQVHAQGGLLRATGAQWRRNVLAFSPRWFFGNQIEAALRSTVAHAGPHSYATAKRVLGQLDPETRAQVEARTTSGGNYEAAARISSDRIIRRESKDLGRFATALYKLRETPGPKQIADAYGAYTDVVFRSLNGRLETQFQTAMLGKALRDHPLMSDRVRKLSSEAVKEAAEGLKDTATQAELGRLVDDMYGRYGKFSPSLRGAIANYTPFAAWTLNAVNFLGHVLPRDHPVLAGLLASANEATADWRKSIGSFYDPTGKTAGQLPPYLQGAIKGRHGSHLRVSRYTPFGLFDSGINSGAPLEGLAGLLLPQWSEIQANVFHGTDWKGKDLAANPTLARDLIAGAASFIEGQVPLASQAAAVAGKHLPNEADVKVPEDVPLLTRARKTFDPFMYTQGKKPKAKVRRKSASSSSSSSTSSGGGWGSGATYGSSSSSGSSSGGWGSSAGTYGSSASSGW